MDKSKEESIEEELKQLDEFINSLEKSVKNLKKEAIKKQMIIEELKKQVENN